MRRPPRTSTSPRHSWQFGETLHYGALMATKSTFLALLTGTLMAMILSCMAFSWILMHLAPFGPRRC